MSILNKFIHRNDSTTQAFSSSMHDMIESILLVLENLSVMNKEQIIQRIENSEYYDETILEKLHINAPSNLNYIEKYYGKTKFGYGPIKIGQLREKLNQVADEKYAEGLRNEKILESFLTIVEPEIVAYSGILIRFNESLHQVEENSSDYNTLTSMIEYWKNYYKEQEMGYPVPIEKKIDAMVEEFRNLPYGGFGEDEIHKFVDAAKKMAEEARLNQEESSHTLSRITTDLYTPKKNRYLSDLEELKKRLQMIDESPYLSDFEKEQEKQKEIKAFNVLNGHKQGLSSYVEQLQQNLAKLEFGGYGEEVLNQFMKRAEVMISDGKRIMKPEEEVQKDIQRDYERLVDAYQTRLQKLREQINEVDKDWLPQAKKEQKKALLLEEFHDEMGLPIDFKERLNAMILELKGLEHGGYGDLRIEEFKNKSLERLESANNRLEIRDALKEIREFQAKLVDDYQEDLRKLYDASERVQHDRHLNAMEKQRAVEEFEREFKFKMGYRMNFNKYIENRAEELSTLPGGGYGREAINEFCELAQGIAKGVDEEKEKYDKIRLKFNAYKKQYDTNLQTFKEWKRIQLKNASVDKKDTLEKDLNVKIAYMLSLSPSALRDYYLEDDRKKKEEADQHNYNAAFRFIARKEAMHSRDEHIYEQRLKELEMGKKPYTQAEIDEATAELELLSIAGDELQEDERIITLVEYIDSTLLRQMMYVEASLLKDQ